VEPPAPESVHSIAVLRRPADRLGILRAGLALRLTVSRCSCFSVTASRRVARRLPTLAASVEPTARLHGWAAVDGESSPWEAARRVWRETPLRDVGIDGHIEYVNADGIGCGSPQVERVLFCASNQRVVPFTVVERHRRYWNSFAPGACRAASPKRISDSMGRCSGSAATWRDDAEYLGDERPRQLGCTRSA
jgi:hypothetical protein